MLKKDAFGQFVFLKKLVFRLFGRITFNRFTKINSTQIKGAELLSKLQDTNILFVSNHQSYFADVTLMFHVIHSALAGFPNELKLKPLLNFKKDNIHYIAAEETMKSGFLPKILALTGAIPIKRTWREAGKNIKREVDKNDTENIKHALETGWVITFPQGTTRAYADGRKGTAHIIKNYKPIVIPIVVDGFRRAFDKKGLFIKKKGVVLKLKIKEPLNIDYNDSVENILAQVMDAIEQSDKFKNNLI